MKHEQYTVKGVSVIPKGMKKSAQMDGSFHGRGERTQTFDLSVPNRARYQLRHTPIGVVLE